MEQVRLHLARPIMLGRQFRYLSGPERCSYEMGLSFELADQWALRGPAAPLPWARLGVIRYGSRVPDRDDLAAGALRVRDVLLCRDIGRPYGNGLVLEIGEVACRYAMVPAARIGTVVVLDPRPWSDAALLA